ncbi:hypothetical protein Q3G72_017150 [Acer saccharum]|nr:hypothetical protein Q3G72_017150 [Acer saccharum]
MTRILTIGRPRAKVTSSSSRLEVKDEVETADWVAIGNEFGCMLTEAGVRLAPSLLSLYGVHLALAWAALRGPLCPKRTV